MRTHRRPIWWLGALIAAAWAGLFVWAGLVPQPAAAAGPVVLTTRVDGIITPVIASHLVDGVRRAEADGAAAYLVELDTPGGLDSSMREIVQA
ncbi:MAG TPA: hypothetical protein VGJ44_27505, partial [Kribbellaceae bacterium]